MAMAKVEMMDLGDIKDTEPDRDHGDLSVLQLSIKLKGMLVPILADQSGAVLDGRRRIAVARMLKMEQVPVVQMKLGSPAARRAVALVCNLVRKNLAPAEAVAGVGQFHRMMSEEKGVKGRGRPKDSGAEQLEGHTQKDTGKLLGLSPGSVSRYLNLNDALQKYPEKKSLRKARSLDAMDEILRKMAAKGGEAAKKKVRKNKKVKTGDLRHLLDVEPEDRAVSFITWYETQVVENADIEERTSNGRCSLQRQFELAEQRGAKMAVTPTAGTLEKPQEIVKNTDPVGMKSTKKKARQPDKGKPKSKSDRTIVEATQETSKQKPKTDRKLSEAARTEAAELHEKPEDGVHSKPVDDAMPAARKKSKKTAQQPRATEPSGEESGVRSVETGATTDSSSEPKTEAQGKFKDLGLKVIDYRVKHGLTFEEFTEQLGLTVDEMNTIEAGETVPTPEQLQALVEVGVLPKPGESKKPKRARKSTTSDADKGSQSSADADTGDPKGEDDTASTTSKVAPPANDKQKPGAEARSKKTEANTNDISRKWPESKFPKESARQCRRLDKWQKDQGLSDMEVAEILKVPLLAARRWSNGLKHEGWDLKEALDKSDLPEKIRI